MKAELRRITVLVTDHEYAEIQRLADGRPLSKWIRKQILQPGSEGNGSANHQDVQRVPEGNHSGRRGGVARRSPQRTTPRVERKDANLGSKKPTAKPSIDGVTKANFAEEMSLILREEVDVWARSLPRSVLPGHDATSHRLTCMCSTCLEWRRANAIPYGGAPKKESRWAK